MKRTRAHHNLVVWQKALDLVEHIYAITKTFPKEELYGLTSQIRRAAISVPSNIAEGAARSSNKEFLYFLSISRGSLSELETQVEIARRVGYIQNTATVEEQVEAIFALLGGLIKSIRNK